MRTVEELEALLELATRERDEVRAKSDAHERYWHAAKIEFGTALAKMGEAVRAQAAEGQQLAKQMMDERDEARAEVQRLTDERDELILRVADQDAELRATREAYADAYRRGVEAMRESWCRMRAMPIPEEP